MTLKKETHTRHVKVKSTDARTTFVEHDDGKFIRSAYVVSEENSERGSIAILDKDGRRIALINIMGGVDGGPLMIDVIDVDHEWKARTALAFPDSCREFIELGASTIVAAHFEGRKR